MSVMYRDRRDAGRVLAQMLRPLAHAAERFGGAGHLFGEPGALGEVSSLAAARFERHLAPGFTHAGQE